MPNQATVLASLSLSSGHRPAPRPEYQISSGITHHPLPTSSATRVGRDRPAPAPEDREHRSPQHPGLLCALPRWTPGEAGAARMLPRLQPPMRPTRPEAPRLASGCSGELEAEVFNRSGENGLRAKTERLAAQVPSVAAGASSLSRDLADLSWARVRTAGAPPRWGSPQALTHLHSRRPDYLGLATTMCSRGRTRPVSLCDLH